MKIITFAAGNEYFVKMAQELQKSAHGYDTTIYGTRFLMQHDHFWNNHKEFIEKNLRGYGYWIWKPFLIQQIMKTMEDGEVLFYCDSDFILKKDRTFLEKLKKDVKNNKIISSSKCEKELKWNKTDTIKRIGVNLTEEDIQIQAGTLLIYLCKETRLFIDEWYSICCEKNYHYIDDTPSIEPNHKTFIEHRHDQSIFSLLLKKHNINFGISINSAITPHKPPITSIRMRRRR